jgi:hypothetical protein
MAKGKAAATATATTVPDPVPFAPVTPHPGYAPPPLVTPTTMAGLREWLQDIEALGVSGTADVTGNLTVHASGVPHPGYPPPPATTVAA